MSERGSGSPQVLATLVRRRAGVITSTLIRILGARHLDLIDDVVHDALVKALEVWPTRGIPNNPDAWLVQTAKNRALNELERRSLWGRKIEAAFEAWSDPSAAPTSGLELAASEADDVVAMLFFCCDPELSQASRVALTLKIVAGLSTTEIARAFLARESTIGQRVVRAKRVLAARCDPVVLPSGSQLGARVDSVLDVLYLWFNEGHLATQGDSLVCPEHCGESLWLARLVANHPQTRRPVAHALVALLAFAAARLPARVDGEGNLLLLRDQDRGRWDPRLLHLGFAHLERASSGESLTAYHVEAGIAACHASATSYAQTDWVRVVSLYDQLVELRPSPVTTLNRAVAVSRLHGPEAGLAALSELDADSASSPYPLHHAVVGELCCELGRYAEAEARLCRALSMRCSTPMRRFLAERRAAVERALGRIA